MNILFLMTTGDRVGGAEVQYEYLIKGLDRDKFRSIVAAPHDGDLVDSFRADEIETIITPIPRWRKFKSTISRRSAVRNLTKIAIEKKIDLIHADWYNSPYLNALRSKLDLPTIVHIRGPMRPDQFRKYRIHDATHAISIGTRYEKMLTENGVDLKKISFISNATDTKKFCPIDSENNQNGKIAIGFVGRIEPFKKQLEFLTIVKKIIARDQNVIFYFVGELLNSDYTRSVQKFVIENRLENFVVFTGKRNDMPKCLTEFHFLVTLSSGSIVIEAMACGLPVIYATDADPKDLKIVQHEKTGLIAPTKNFDAIANAIIRLIENADLRERFGKIGRDRAEQFFSVDRMIDLTTDVYENLTNAKKLETC